MILAENILPVREMEGKDWDKIYAGFVISVNRDWHTPSANVFAGEIIEYLLNTELHKMNYTQYHAFHFSPNVYIAEPIYYYPEGVELLDQEYENLVCNLHVYMPDAKRFAKVNKHEALCMIAQSLLDSIPKYLFGRDDFNGEKFYADILPIIKPIADGTRVFREEEFPI